MNTVQIDNLIRTHRRSMALIVNGEGIVTVRAPFKMPLSTIERFLDEKREWVARKIRQAQLRPKAANREFINGEKFLFLVQEYPLQIVDRLKSGLEFRDALELSSASQKQAKGIFYHWYKYQAKKMINERVNIYAQKMGLEYRAIKINDAQTRWGSCAPSGNLNFAWRIIMAPLSVLDYVVVHELAHIPIKNHSRRFWKKVEITMPGYRQSVEWLKHHGGLLKL